jgi:hypothetical protein
VTREELLDRLRELRDEVVGVDTDVAAIAAVMTRMLEAGDDLSRLTEAALDVEEAQIRARDARRRAGRN